MKIIIAKLLDTTIYRFQTYLNFYNNKRPIKTASDIQARNKIFKSSMNSWEKYEKYLKDYFKKLAH